MVTKTSVTMVTLQTCNVNPSYVPEIVTSDEVL